MNQARKKRLQNINAGKATLTQICRSGEILLRESLKNIQTHTLGMHRINKDKRRKRQSTTLTDGKWNYAKQNDRQACTKQICLSFLCRLLYFSTISIYLSFESESALILSHTHTYASQCTFGIRTCNWHNVQRERSVHRENTHSVRATNETIRQVCSTFARFYLLLLFDSANRYNGVSVFCLRSERVS